MLRRRTFILLALLAPWGLAQPRAYALPDAQVVRIDVQGEDLRTGDRVPVSVEIRNGGESPLPPVAVTLAVDREPYADWVLPNPLAPGETVAWHLTYTGERGMHLLVAAVNPLNEVPETDYGNNSTFISLGLAEPGSRASPFALAAGIASFLVGIAAGILLARPQRSRRTPPRPAPGRRRHRG